MIKNTVAVIGPTYPYKGGISHFTTVLVNKMKENQEVEFISWKRQYPKFLYPVEQKDTVSKENIKSEALFKLDFINPLTWISTALYIYKKKISETIFTWVTPIQGIVYLPIILILKLVSSTKITFLCHNVLPHEKHFFDYPLLKLNFLFGNKFIVHSTEDENNLLNIVKNKTVIRAFHPIYEDFNKGEIIDTQQVKNKLKLKKNVLLFFGYIREYKGLMYLIKAMPDILKDMPDTTLLIVGEFWSNDKNKYDKVVADLGLKNNVSFIDKYVPNEDIPLYFNTSDIVIVPYTSATQSGIIQIAYAFNKPVIATNVGGLGEVIEEGITGYIVDPRQSDQISFAVLSYFKDNKINLEHIEEKYSWKSYINKLNLREILYEITDIKSIAIHKYIDDFTSEIKDKQTKIIDWRKSFLKLNGIRHFHYSNSTYHILIPLIFQNKNNNYVTVHDIFPRNTVLKKYFVNIIYRIINFKSTKIIVHSNFSKKLLINEFPYLENNVVVIPFGYKILEYTQSKYLDLRNEYGIPTDNIVFLYVGYIKKSKGLLNTINAFNKINNVNINLIIVGKIVDDLNLNELILDERIKYMGFVDDLTLSNFFILSNALVNFRSNSVGESSSAVNQMISYGKPVLCTDIGPNKEVISNAGLYCIDTEYDIQKCLEEFISSSDLMSELSRNAKILRNKQKWSNINNQYNEIFFQ